MRKLLRCKNIYVSLILLMVLLLGQGNDGFGQTTGDYRSSANGSWAAAGTWQTYNGSTWVPATLVPGATNNVLINNLVTIDDATIAEAQSITINSTGKLVVEGKLTVATYLTMNFDGNDESELVLAAESQVIVGGDVSLGNKVSLVISSYFIIKGDLTKQGNGNPDLSISGAHIYIFGEVDPLNGFTTCSTQYLGTTNSISDVCDYGNLNDLIINDVVSEVPEIAAIIQSSAIQVSNLTPLSACFCTGGNVTLTIGESGTISLLKWYQGNTILSTVTDPGAYTFPADQAGSYYALYKIGTTWYQTNTVTVTSTPTPTASISGTSTICNGTSATLSIALTGTGPWNFTYTDGTTPVTVIGQAASTYIVDVSPTLTKTYTLTSVSTDCCVGTISGSAIITVNMSNVSISSQSTDGQTRCIGAYFNPISVVATASMGSITGYQWYSNTIATTSGGTPLGSANGAQTNIYTPQSSLTGTYYYYCVVTGTCGSATSAVSGAFTVNTKPTIAVSPNTSICSGSSTTLSANGGTSYSWSPSAGLSSTNGSSVTANPAITTLYTVTGTDGNGCTNTAQVTVIVNVRPTAVVSGTATICNGSSTSISAGLTGTGPWDVTWSDGVVQIGVANSSATRSVNPTSDNAYTVTALTDSKCTSQPGDLTGSAVITVNPLPTGTLSNSGPVCLGSSALLTFTKTAGTGPFDLVINETSYTNIASGSTISVTPSAPSTTYTLTSITDKGVTLNCQNIMSVPTTVTVNADASLSLTSGSATPAICINNAITDIVYILGGAGTGASITSGSLPEGLTGAYNSGDKTFTISGTPSVSGSFPFTVTTTGSSCNNPSLSGTITVNADASLSLTSGSATPATCINNAITNIVYILGGAGTGASITSGSLPAGLTGTYNSGAKTFTISGAPSVSGSFPFTVTTTGSSCLNPSMSGTITVNALPTPIITGSAAVCAGLSGTVYSTPDVSGHTYVWTVVGGNVTAGSGTHEITVTWGTAGNGTVDVTEAITSTGCSAGATRKNVTINALPAPTVTGDLSPCNKTTGVIYSTEPGMTEYAWNVSGGTITSGQGTNSITVTWNTAGSQNVTVNYKNGNGCIGTATSYTIMVHPIPAIGSFN